MRTEPFDFRGADGQHLSGRLDLPAGPTRAFAVFAHCFTCTKMSLAASRIAEALAARQFGVLRFDFTGLGHSGGDFSDSTFSGSIRDVVAAASALAASGRSPRVLIGHSLGGAAVLAAAMELPDVVAVSTIGAPYDVHHVERLFGEQLHQLLEDGEAEVDIGGRPFRVRKEFVEDLALHDQHQRIADLHRALLVLHAPRDKVVGIENAAAIFQSAKHPKSFISLDQADHLLTDRADAEYTAEIIAAWASRFVGGVTSDQSAPKDRRVVVEETGMGAFQVAVSAAGTRFLADEPTEAGGLGSGPTPYDLLCAALGACTAMTVRLYARAKTWPLQQVCVRVGHSRDTRAKPADIFTRELALSGPIDEAQRTRLLEIADRCPVHRTLSAGSRVVTTEAGVAAPLPPSESPNQHAVDVERVCFQEP